MLGKVLREQIFNNNTHSLPFTSYIRVLSGKDELVLRLWGESWHDKRFFWGPSFEWKYFSTMKDCLLSNSSVRSQRSGVNIFRRRRQALNVEAFSILTRILLNKIDFLVKMSIWEWLMKRWVLRWKKRVFWRE